MAIALIYLITAIEATGDITANSMISGKSIEGEGYLKRISGGVLADGVNSFISGIFISFPNSIFAQNNGIIQLTGVASRYVGYYIAGMLILLGLFPVVGVIFSLMPDPVLGGATLLMFGTVAGYFRGRPSGDPWYFLLRHNDGWLDGHSGEFIYTCKRRSNRITNYGIIEATHLARRPLLSRWYP